MHTIPILNSGVTFVRDLRAGVLDLVYPPFCVICKRPAEQHMCEECIEKITLIEFPYCRRCGAPSDSTFCRACDGREFVFDSAHCVAIFEGVLREAIHSLKYGCFAAVADPLGDLMARRLSRTTLPGKVDCVVPVPIHRSRMLRRGFNQAGELASRICANLPLPLHKNVLCQARKTKHQVDLTEEERVTNVRGAFAVRNAPKIAGKRVMLVDDVFTTGSTLNEAASVLRSAGAKAVHVYALARSL